MDMRASPYPYMPHGGRTVKESTTEKEGSQLAFTTVPDKFSLTLNPEITCLPITVRLELRHAYLY